jgi:NitT/TauT family transport system ATP-binding protein
MANHRLATEGAGPSVAAAEQLVTTRAIRVQGVTHAFAAARSPANAVVALRDVSLEVWPGEFVAIVGPSGCGKTTLLNILAGLERPTSGTVLVAGKPPRAGAPEVGYLFARDSLLPWRTALGNAALAMEMRGVPADERRERARRMLADVGLDAFANAYRAQLSQGMRQRVALARALAAEPEILLMDEPFSALDAQTRILVQDLFLSLWSRLHISVVLITHDLAEAIALADRVVLFTRAPGRIKAIFPVELPRPRSIQSLQADSAYHQIYESVWRDLQDEVTASGSGRAPVAAI